MILGRKDILQEHYYGRIYCQPFDSAYVGANSLDVHLGPTLKRIGWNCNQGIDPRKPQSFEEIQMTPDGFWLHPDDLILGHTIEAVGSDYFVPDYNGRSSVGRMGLMSHISAGWGEVGFKAQWTLEFSCVEPILIYPGMKIGAVRFCTVSDASMLYGRNVGSHYSDQVGVQESRFGEVAK